MSAAPGSRPDRVQVHVVTPEERNREIESSETRAIGGFAIAAFSGLATYLTATGKDPEIATIVFELASGVFGLGVCVDGIKRILTLRQNSNKKVFEMSESVLEKARGTEKRQPKQEPSKVDRVSSFLQNLWRKGRESSKIPTDEPAARPKPTQPASKTAQKPHPSTVPSESTPEKKRRSASYLHSFFRITQERSINYIAEQQQIVDLVSEKATYPDGVYEETEAIRRHVTEHMLKPNGQKSWTIYNTESGSKAPSGLSVAIALFKLGFGTENATRQFAENSITSSEGVARTRAFVKLNDYHLTAHYEYNGTDTKVVLRVKPLQKPKKPTGQQSSETDESAKEKRKTSRRQPIRLHGHSLDEPGTRKRGVPNP